MVKVKAYTSSPVKKWQEIKVVPATGQADNIILGKSSERVFEGFGSTANELVMAGIEQTDQQSQEKIFDQFFKANFELNLEICRVPIGASDFALNWYSHNETAGDFEMENFSISRDHQLIIPFIKEALKRNPNLIISACPWSPPTWLKQPAVYNYGKLIWEEKYLNAYALYLTKFVQAYAEEGITIHQLHVQNEVVADQKFPSCQWTGVELRDFIRNYLGPMFTANNLTTEIWLGTINAPETNTELIEERTEDYNVYAGLVLKDPEAYQYISGVGYQWAGKNAIVRNIEAYPELRYYQTELECGNGKNTWLYAHYAFNLYRHYLNAGANGFIYWNGVLKPGGESTWGWHQNSMLTIAEDGQVTYNPEFYLMKHFSKFIKKGAVGIQTSGRLAPQSVAFKNQDSATVVVLANPLKEAEQAIIKVEDQSFAVELEADSFTTIVLTSEK